MTNEIVTWEEAVIFNQERNIALFEEKKVMITTCTSNERLNEMQAQIKGVLLTAQEMKLRSIVEDAIELLALIRWQFAEINPPRKPGPQKDNLGDQINSPRKITPYEASINRKYARQWPNKEALEADIAAMRSGDQEAERKLVVLDRRRLPKTSTSVINPALLLIPVSSDAQIAIGNADRKLQALIAHCDTTGGIDQVTFDVVEQSMMWLNRTFSKLQVMRPKTKIRGV